MDTRVFSDNSIRRFKTMKGKSRLGVKNELTQTLLDLPEVIFLESRARETDFGTWEEYYALLNLKKIESSEYFLYLLYRVGTIFKLLEKYDVDSSGIQELDCSEKNYSLLIYIIRNGKDKENGEYEYYNELFGELY